CPSGHSPSVPSQAQGGAARPETLLASIPNSTTSPSQLEGRLPRRPRCKINPTSPPPMRSRCVKQPVHRLPRLLHLPILHLPILAQKPLDQAVHR
ncbi:hypothetical protein QEH56_24480, partial [Pelagicoccus enzymogenes]|uniref:hypothetical protein n=1 Tax=Pelagicoccus enzymogenes TaxID=2773457 RepID=UPI00280C57BA